MRSKKSKDNTYYKQFCKKCKEVDSAAIRAKTAIDLKVIHMKIELARELIYEKARANKIISKKNVPDPAVRRAFEAEIRQPKQRRK